jgi:2-hydroxychromene-2-carboxylate isomerase
MLPGGRDVQSCRAQAATVWTISQRGDDAPPSPNPSPQRVDSVIDPTNLPSLARAERTSVPRKNWPSDHTSACIRWARNPHSKTFDFAELDRGALVAIEDGRGAEYVTAVFAAIWGKPEDLSQRSVLIDVLDWAGFDAQLLLERASAGAMIAQLEAETKAAAERGVFGAPTMFVGDQMYFGNDRFDFVVEALRSAA